MAICALNSNILRNQTCGYNLPEVVTIYLVNYSDLSGTPETSATTAGCEEITAVTLQTSAKVYKIEPAKNSASFEDTLTVQDNGNKYRHASLTFSVNGKYDACQHANLDALSLGRYFAVLALADGGYIGLGRINPIEAETATFAGGNDSSGIQIILSGNIAESPLPLSDAAVTALLSNVAS